MKLFTIPNFLTLINLLSGCLAIVLVFSFHLHWVPVCVAVSLIADFFDGMAARALRQADGLGKQLDSLADVVSFGVVPSAVVFQLLFQYWESRNLRGLELLMLSLPAFLIAAFAALRLAKFNVDERQTSGFIGLATPAATIFVIGLLMVFLRNSFGLTDVIFQPATLYATIGGLCFFMVAEIPMFSFKLKKLQWRGNELQIVFLVLVALLAATLKFAAIPLSIMLYIILSIIQPCLQK